MQSFSYYCPTKVLFGKDSEQQVAQQVQEFGGSRVFVVYGGGSVVRSGLLGRVQSALDGANLPCRMLGGVQPNPRLGLARQGVQEALSFGADFILAVGGGSVIDTAKAIAHGVAEPSVDIWDYLEGTRTVQKSLPVGVILTISAAGSEMSDSSVLTNEGTGVKRGLSTPFNRPRFAVMNPELTMTLPPYQTASGCVDILMHTMERYFTPNGTMELTDSIAEGLMRTVMKNAVILRDEPQNYNARAEMMWAGSLSHNGLTGCGSDGGDWACHGLEHEIGGMFDVTHGAGLAAVWGSWARYVYRDCMPRFVRFAVNVMGADGSGSDEEVALEGIQAMEDFYRAIHMPTCFSELGISPTQEQLETMAHMLHIACGGKKGAAKVLTEADFLKIYEDANH